jgi:hypothetical protein
MRTEKSLGPVDWLALVVFVAGSFGLVLMGLSAISGDELAAPHGTARVAIEWIAAIGLAPSLLFNAAVAYLGARTFLRSHARGLLRDLAGSAAVALGASVACGVFAAGGALGEATGGALAAASNKALAAIAGAFAIVVPAWIAWLRAAALKPAPLVKPDETGVGGAETAGLVGDDEPFALVQPLAPSAPAPARLARDPLANPYPDDARLRGEIPPGTKPLIVSASTPVEAVEIQGLAGDFDASFDDEPVVATPLQPRATGSATAAVVEVDEALEQSAAELSSALEALESRESAAASEEIEAPSPVVPSWERTGLTSEDEPVDAYGTPLSLVEKVRAEVAGKSAQDAAETTAQAAFDELETELAAQEESRPAEMPAVEPDDDAQDELAHEEVFEGHLATVGIATAPASSASVVAIDEIEEPSDADFGAELEPDDADFGHAVVESSPMEGAAVVLAAPAAVQPAVVQDVARSDDAAEDESAEHESAEHEAMLEEVVSTSVVLDEEDAQAEESDVEFEAECAAEELEAELEAVGESEGTIEVAEAAIDAPPRVAAEIGFDDQTSAVEAVETALEVGSVPVATASSGEVEGEGANSPRRATRKKGKAHTEPAAPSLFDGGLFAIEADAIEADAVEADAVEADAGEAVASAQAEPQVELQPQAAAPGASIKTPALDPGRRELLDEVGCLFVERGRVAVSMLQKQYGMDFDEACVVLDDLQELGLIGPYLGGQRRDILLTRDQWKERLAKA